MTQRLIDFLNASPVNFLAVEELKRQLTAHGFRHLCMGDEWNAPQPGDTFFITKNDSSLYAVRIGRKPIGEVGAKLICAHCDSPTFRIKPQAEMNGEGNIIRLNTEVYGGPIMSTWFDRPLSLAGRVILRGDNALRPVTRLLHIRKPLLIIPNLAIHFNRQVNDGVKLSKQKDMLPLMDVCSFIEEGLQRDEMLLHLIARELKVTVEDILDFDLYLYDTTPACTVGVNDELVSSGRLDDLSMVHAGLEALLAAGVTDQTHVLAIFDNEETGSMTKQGAQAPILRNLLLRIAGSETNLIRAIEHSFMVSADNAHAFHPNYSDKYDPTNHPLMGFGPVIKINAAQKYATDARSAAIFASICREAGVPCQTFVNHSDVAGGSTLGNILTSSLPIAGVDMGNPIWAMHSARETASARDHIYCVRAFTKFYNL